MAGNTAFHPYGEWTAEEVEDGSPDDIVAACERVAQGTSADHSAIAEAAIQAVLDRHNLDRGEAHADVRRSAGKLKVRLHMPPGTDRHTGEVATVRVAEKLRAYDPSAAGIDIGVTV